MDFYSVNGYFISQPTFNAIVASSDEIVIKQSKVITKFGKFPCQDIANYPSNLTPLIDEILRLTKRVNELNADSATNQRRYYGSK